MIEPGKPDKLTDVELLEALELGAARIRMASPQDLRHVGDALGGLALEAAGRLRDVLEISPRRPPEGLDVCGVRGKVRNVVIHQGGRMTCELEIEAGDQFLEQIRNGARLEWKPATPATGGRA